MSEKTDARFSRILRRLPLAAEQDNAQLRARVAQLETELAALKEAHRWIPVSERLPEESVPVQVLCAFGRVTARISNSGSGEWLSMPGSYSLARVTHWQPLPPGPESEVQG